MRKLYNLPSLSSIPECLHHSLTPAPGSPGLLSVSEDLPVLLGASQKGISNTLPFQNWPFSTFKAHSHIMSVLHAFHGWEIRNTHCTHAPIARACCDSVFLLIIPTGIWVTSIFCLFYD